MKILEYLWVLLCFVIAFLGLYSSFNKQDITLEQTKTHEGIVSEINSDEGTTEYIFENDSINVYIITSITDGEINHSEIDILETGQNYKVHHVNYHKGREKMKWKKKIITLSKNGQNVLSLQQYNEGQRSNILWGRMIGVAFLILGLFLLIMIFCNVRIIY